MRIALRSPHDARDAFHPSGDGTWAPVSPDNVQETGVSPGGQSRSPIVAAEPSKLIELEERAGHGTDPRFLCPTGDRRDHEGHNLRPPRSLSKRRRLRMPELVTLGQRAHHDADRAASPFRPHSDVSELLGRGRASAGAGCPTGRVTRRTHHAVAFHWNRHPDHFLTQRRAVPSRRAVYGT
jgi:hypothetical protein